MINWQTKEGHNAISFIKTKLSKGESFREIALLINEKGMLPEIITSEQVRGVKRHYLNSI